MNILPKKRWHVRTRENIARVRRDEAEAAKEEEEKKRRIKLAEKEARLDALRKKRGIQPKAIPISSGIVKDKSDVQSELKHINFFEEIEEENYVSTKTNADHEEEKKQEREKYEKQIGYLTYLGGDTRELTGEKAWYEDRDRDKSSPEDNAEVSCKQKNFADPLGDIRAYIGEVHKASKPESAKKKSEHQRNEEKRKSKRKKEHKHKKREKEKTYKLVASKSIEILRAERLKREKEEKMKAEKLLANLRGEQIPDSNKDGNEAGTVRQKYNSQFNPDIARQNAIK